MWKRITNIWRKELTDSLRDRKALRTSLLIPVLVGILFALIPAMMDGAMPSSPDEAFETETISIIGEAYLPSQFIEILDQFAIELEPYTGSIEALSADVKAGDIETGLVVPDRFEADLEAGLPASPIIIRDVGTGFTEIGSQSRLSWAFDQYNDQLVKERLTAEGLDPDMLTPIRVETRNTAIGDEDDPASRFSSYMTGLYFPMILAMAIGAGGLMTAIDVTAGEKERGTLESLLLTPATDTEIFTGKTLAVFTMTFVPTVLTVLVYVFASNVIAPLIWQDYVSLSITGDQILVAIALCIPFMLLVGLAQMLLALRTKAAKDAQNVAQIANMFVIFPMMAGAFMRPENPLLYAIPGFGTASIIGKMIGDESFMSFVPIMLLSLVALVAIGIWLGLRMFDRERLLYGS